MTGLFFGERANPMYGMFHPGTGAVYARKAVILCNPFGEEAIRAFRTYQLLAERLASVGIPTLRFDYIGTGDSAGECQDIRLRTCVDGLLTAHEEVRDMTGASSVIWVGLRFGAMVAAIAAADSPPGLAGVVAWDPVFDGQRYLNELAAGHFQAMAAMDLPARRDDEALGFALPTSFRVDLSSAMPIRDLRESNIRALIIDSDVSTDLCTKAFTVIDDSQTGIWNSDKALNAYIVPHRGIDLVSHHAENW